MPLARTEWCKVRTYTTTASGNTHVHAPSNLITRPVLQTLLVWYGRQVLLEKPFANTTAEACEFAEALLELPCRYDIQ